MHRFMLLKSVIMYGFNIDNIFILLVKNLFVMIGLADLASTRPEINESNPYISMWET